MAKAAYREKPQDIHASNIHILKERIKSKDISGCYIFYGDEEFMKNHYSSQLLTAAGDSLNVTTFYSSEFTLPDFISACSTNAVESFDMFSDPDEETGDGAIRAVKLYSPDLSSLSKKDSDYLLEFLDEIKNLAIVIFWFYAGSDEAVTKGLYKKISEKALVVNFKKEPVGSSVLLTWIIRHFSKEKMNIDRHVALHLCQSVGNSMTDLRCEITKLIDYLKYEGRDALTTEDVDFICIKSSEAQVFDISNGALSGNYKKAINALKILRDKKENPILILGTISKAVNDLCITDIYTKQGLTIPAIAKMCSLPEFIIKNASAALNARSRDFKGEDSFAKTAAMLCAEYDKKLKSSRTDGYELLSELIFKLSFAGNSQQ